MKTVGLIGCGAIGTVLAEAVERATGGEPAQQIVAFRSWSTATLLAKRAPFRPQEIESLKRFCDERGFDLIHYVSTAYQ